MKVLVTGATGNVGSAIVKAAAAKGLQVRAGARTPSRVAKTANVEPVLFDYEKPETFASALAGADGLALLSPPFSPPGEVEQAVALVDAARSAGIRQIVKLSVMGADMNDNLPHRQVEKYVEASGIPFTHLRPNFYMQNYNMYSAEYIKNHDYIYLPAGNGKQSLVDSRDVGSVFAVVFTEPGHAGHAYTLTGAEALDHYEIADILTRVLGREIRYLKPSADEYRRTMTQSGMPEGTIASMIGLYDGVVAQGWAAAISPEITKLLGRPPTTFEQYARDYAWAWQ